MIDSHCHLDFAAFDRDRNAVMQRSQSLGISDIIIPGTQASQWPNLIALCEQHTNLHFALGLHPYFLQSASDNDLDVLQHLLSQQAKKVVAVGEIGLDFFEKTEAVKKRQLHFFEQQLHIAQQHHLPVILHHRNSHNALIQSIKHCKFGYGGVIHAFSGSYQQACTYIELGFKLGVGGTITYERASKTRDVIKRIPLSTILLETDAPDMPLFGAQGERNSPEYLPQIAKVIASLKGIDIEQVSLQTDQNVQQLFGINLSVDWLF
ncbi:TatD family hydrolase [Aliiglaciecola sp. LCG003]|uniref:TatD family hydrolase n=1 Tax=Aliiglaciecola sp. LCG003 TaxID=3053655 RepID=UPI0025745EE3|nr:TatD family hydrolase [Aliiglaciecola sp. LCG003]WJG10496.1 TatD family hydrolase [Aliiglaciecola sp. LCG003]